jgi:hypothetical protein
LSPACARECATGEAASGAGELLGVAGRQGRPFASDAFTAHVGGGEWALFHLEVVGGEEAGLWLRSRGWAPEGREWLPLRMVSCVVRGAGPGRGVLMQALDAGGNALVTLCTREAREADALEAALQKPVADVEAEGRRLLQPRPATPPSPLPPATTAAEPAKQQGEGGGRAAKPPASPVQRRRAVASY